MLGGHDDLALEGAAGERALLEDDDVLRGEAEVAVLLEEVDGRLHRARRRHDVPGNLASDHATFQIFGRNTDLLGSQVPGELTEYRRQTGMVDH